MMVHLLASLTWDPGLNGIILVCVAAGVLFGTPMILLMTNLGSRLGFHIAITAIFGWLTLMFFIWAIYGLGYKGPAPVWQVLETSSAPHAADNPQLQSIPTDLPDPSTYAASNKLVIAAMTGRKTAATMGDVVAADPRVAEQLKPKLNGWRLVASSNPINGDAAATAGEELIAQGYGGMKFQSTNSFVTGTVFDRGGKPHRKDASMMSRVTHRVQSTAMTLIGDNPAHYAVVQVRPTIIQTSLPGEPPPLPVVDPNQPVINVLLVRNLGAVRQPGFAFGFMSLIVFAILAYQLHRRDKAGMEARLAAELAARGA